MAGALLTLHLERLRVNLKLGRMILLAITALVAVCAVYAGATFYLLSL